MREWPESWKKTLRHLAAARFFLPVELDTSKGLGGDEQYLQYLHHREFALALDDLAEIGVENTGYAEEPMFWAELALAAENMGLPDQAALYSKLAVDCATADE
jgi:hypothetical protein